MQDGEFEDVSEQKTGDQADATNGTAIKHEGIKNDISQFQIKVTRIQNDVDAQSYDFENKINPSKAWNEQDARAAYTTKNMTKGTKSAHIDFRRYSMKEVRVHQQTLRGKIDQKSDTEG